MARALAEGLAWHADSRTSSGRCLCHARKSQITNMAMLLTDPYPPPRPPESIPQRSSQAAPRKGRQARESRPVHRNGFFPLQLLLLEQFFHCTMSGSHERQEAFLALPFPTRPRRSMVEPCCLGVTDRARDLKPSRFSGVILGDPFIMTLNGIR